MRIFVSACGEGLGHSSRIAALLAAMKKRGHSGIVATYGPAYERLKKMGFSVFQTYPEVSMMGSGGQLSILHSFLATSKNAGVFLHTVGHEQKKMRKIGAQAVVSDSRLATTIAGNRLGLPVFYISNQTTYPEVNLSRINSGSLGEAAVNKIMQKPASLPVHFADTVVIPDFSPPSTISLPLLSHEPWIKKKTHFIGPMNMASVAPGKPAVWKSGKPKVLVTMGGQAFREGAYHRAVEITSNLQGFDFLISSIFAHKDFDSGSAKVRRFLPNLHSFQLASDILVMPAGHSGIMESILLGKPSLLLPDAVQPEQLSNAHRYKALGFGDFLPLSQMEKLPEKLQSLWQNYSRHKRRLESFSLREKNSMNGAENLVKLCEEFVKRTSY
ncbi:MAG: glycosyltransferase family protein [Candidatus Anstonellaceae archaeon]